MKPTINLKEIEARHERDERESQGAWITAGWHNLHSDRAFLLAEVKRLKALCGRAAGKLSEVLVPMGSDPEHYPLLAELKEAASE